MGDQEGGEGGEWEKREGEQEDDERCCSLLAESGEFVGE